MDQKTVTVSSYLLILLVPVPSLEVVQVVQQPVDNLVHVGHPDHTRRRQQPFIIELLL